MADYGFRLTRDACGKHSVPETVLRSWSREEVREKMYQMAEDEISKLAGEGKDAIIVDDSDRGIVEIHEKMDNRLVSYYEIEEFEQ